MNEARESGAGVFFSNVLASSNYSPMMMMPRVPPNPPGSQIALQAPHDAERKCSSIQFYKSIATCAL